MYYPLYSVYLQDLDPLRLAKAKLCASAEAAALKLMDCVFSTEELVNGNPSGKTKSHDSSRQQTIRMLDPAKMRYIDGTYSVLWSVPIIIACTLSSDTLSKLWPGKTTADPVIRRKMTQKCTDAYNDRRNVHLRASL